MKVDKAKAVRLDFGDETFYFCSEHCLHAFEIAPDDHLARDPTPPGETRAVMGQRD